MVVITPHPPHPKIMTGPVFLFTRNPEFSKWKPTATLREKGPNTEFLPVRIFLCSDWIQVNLHIQSECRKIRTRKNSVSGYFSRRANSSGGKLFLEIGDPVQNYKELYKAYNKKGCRIVPIPARSPDINSVENVFNNVRSKLRTDEWKQEIRYGPYERFCERVCTFKTANIERLTFLLPFSRQEIHEKSTKNEGF